MASRERLQVSTALLLSPGAFLIPTRAEQVVDWNPMTSYPLMVSASQASESPGLRRSGSSSAWFGRS